MKTKRRIAALALCMALGATLAACSSGQQPDGDQLPSTAATAEGAGTTAESNDSGSMDAADTTFTWSEESDCAMCHSTEHASAEDATALYSIHVSLGYEDCGSCHANDNGALAKSHESVSLGDTNTPARLKNSEVSEDGCLAGGCHTLDGITQATASFTGLTDDDGTTVNPHEILTSMGEGHIAEGFTCADCHKMHKQGGNDKQAVADTAMSKCVSCHHDNVFECYTCHD